MRARYRITAVMLGAASITTCTSAGDVLYPARKLFDVHLSLWEAPSFAPDRASDGFPTADCHVTLTARATGEGSAQWEDATFYWYMGVDRTRPVDSTTASASDVDASWGNSGISRVLDERGGWQLSAGLPFDAKIVYRYELNTSHRVRSDSVRFTCGPAAPSGSVARPSLPVVELLPHSGPWQLGDTLGVHFQASSAAGLWFTYAGTAGAFRADSVFDEQLVSSAEHSVAFPIPQSASIDTAEVAGVVAVDVFGQQVAASVTTTPLVDLAPPTLYDTVLIPPHQIPSSTFGGSYFVGDTMRFRTIADDNHGLSYIGWRASATGYGDSLVAYGATADTGVMVIPISSTWLGAPPLTFFATDLAGNTTTITPPPGAFTVYPTLKRPTTTAAIAGGVVDVVFDTARSAVYVLRGGNSQTIFQLSLPSLQLTRTIALPGVPVSADVTPSGDSLVLVLSGQHPLYVVDLRQTTPQATVIPLALDSANAQAPVAVRIAANDAAFVTTSGATVDQYQLLEVDLATGAQRIRTDAGTDVGSLRRSIDRNVLAMWRAGCIERYVLATDAFGACRSIGDPTSIDGRGDYFAVGFAVYDSTLTLLRQVSTVGETFWFDNVGTALSADGVYLYECLPWEGLVRARVSDGALVDRSIAPAFNVCEVHVAPDGATAVLTSSNPLANGINLAAVDLRDADAQPVQMARSPSRAAPSFLRGSAIRGAARTPRGLPLTSSGTFQGMPGIRPKAVPIAVGDTARR